MELCGTLAVWMYKDMISLEERAGQAGAFWHQHHDTSGAGPPGPASAAPDGHMRTRRGGVTAHSCCGASHCKHACLKSIPCQLPHKRIDMVKLPCVKLRSFDGTPIKRAWLT